MAFIAGFAPWVVYWALVGNTPFLVAVLVALALSLLINVVAVVRHKPLMVLEVGTLVVFVVFAILAATVSTTVLERWLQPLGNLGLFMIVLASILVGKPFTLQYARLATPEEIWDEPGFVYVCRVLAWVWVAAMGFMTLVSAIPPIVDGSATIRDETDLLSIVCYWVLPFAALGLAMVFSMKFPAWFADAIDADVKAARSDPQTLTVPQASAAVRGLSSIRVEPADVRTDEAFVVEVLGLDPASPVSVSAETLDLFGDRWTADLELVADADGSVALGSESEELIWAMKPTQGVLGDLFIPSGAPSAVVVRANSGDLALSTMLVRHGRDQGATVVDVNEPGLVGRLYLPEASAPVPGVVLFPGSEGGLHSQASNADVLVSHGCAVLVAATFAPPEEALPGLPTQLSRIGLETFATAIQWLAGRDEVDARRVSAMAISRGAEGLLAAASKLDLGLASLIAVSPSSVTWVGLGEYGSLPGVPAWTLGGVDLPALNTADEALYADMAREALRRRGRKSASVPAPLRLVHSYAPLLGDARAMEAAAIVVEDINCPVILIAGTDDQVWPSVDMAQAVFQRRAASGVASAADDQLLVYPAAGHFFRLGLWPTTGDRTSGIALGGKPEAHAAGQRDLTPRVLAAVSTLRQPVA